MYMVTHNRYVSAHTKYHRNIPVTDKKFVSDTIILTLILKLILILIIIVYENCQYI